MAADLDGNLIRAFYDFRADAEARGHAHGDEPG
jgi:hypothetical protein